MMMMMMMMMMIDDDVLLGEFPCITTTPSDMTQMTHTHIHHPTPHTHPHPNTPTHTHIPHPHTHTSHPPPTIILHTKRSLASDVKRKTRHCEVYKPDICTDSQVTLGGKVVRVFASPISGTLLTGR